MSANRTLFRALMVPLTLAALPLAGTARAQTIRNTASLSFATAGGGDATIASNTVEFTRGRYPTKISFRRLPADFQMDWSQLRCEPDQGLRFTPQPLTAAQLAQARPLQSLDIDNPSVFVLEAPGQNHDPDKIETAVLVADSGVRKNAIVLTETGPNTGVFAGAVPPSSRKQATPNPCDVTADNSGTLTLSFDGDDLNQSSTNRLLIDPLGRVFDSATGVALDGATVTVIDDATGAPTAMVYGDDGVSSYPNSVVTGSTVSDSSGWSYKLDAGEFRFPMLPQGRYHLQVTPPSGYTFPSTATAQQMAGLRDPDGVAYSIVTGSYGGSFTLSDPFPVTFDVPVDSHTIHAQAVSPLLVVDKVASVADASLGDFVQYRIEVRNTGDGAATQATVTDTLPRGLRYRRGSSSAIAEPTVSSDGRTLRFTLTDLQPGALTRFAYVVEVAPDAPTGAATNHAVASAPGSRISNDASATVRIRPALFADAFTLIGRVTLGDCANPDRGRKGVAGIRLLMDDGSYVLTDADGLYHFEGARPGTHVVQIDVASVPRSYAPVACDHDTRSAGSGISRFVEGSGGSLQRVDFQLRPTGLKAEAADALPVTPLADAAAAGNRDDWLAQATPGTGWLFPDENHNPRAPAVRVVIRHAPDQRVALTIEGKQVDPLSFDGSDSDRARGVAISRWTGLPLVEGDNRLEARVLNADGSVATTLTRIVHYANNGARAVYVPEKSRLVADGLTRPLIAVRVTDRDGHPVRTGTPVPFRVDQPYRAAQAVAAEQGRQLAGLERAQTVAHVVGDDGLAFIALEPTRQSGMVRLTVNLADREREVANEVKAWLAAPAQDWVLVGFGKGSLGYDRLSGAERLARGKGGETVSDGQLTLYAKGRIKGSWLLTMAYDSAKDREAMRERGAFGTIDPNRYYTVYGDGTLQGYDAASRRKLYLRLERREFFALFGDFETGLTDTKLGRYSRTLNGAKLEYTGKRVHVTGFGAHDDNRYGRDEIQGNGLSGPYRLSARDLVPNSDKLRLETRDRLRPDRVLDTRDLVRNIDYDIDPVAGTIRFREPILSRDAALNPVFIVADYETHGGTRKLAAGGRASAMIGKAEVGATLLHDESIGNATIAAADVRAHVSKDTEVRAEAATGGRNGIAQGQSMLAELEHHGRAVDLLVYARQQDSDFGLGQQNAGEVGTRKIGFEGHAKIADRWSFAGSGWYQEDLDDAAKRIAADLRVEYHRKTGTIFAGARFASDHGVQGGGGESQLLSFGTTQSLLGNRLQLTSESDLPIAGKDDSVDFPARQHFGAAWRVRDGIRLLGDYELARGKSFTAQNARLGFDLAPWVGGRLLASMNRGAIAENGERTFAQYGLSQSLPVSKRWTIDATVDSASTLSGHIPTADIVNPLHPVSTGGLLGTNGTQEDFVAATFGATYTATRWSWNGRIEYRDGSREQRWGLTSNLLRSLGGGSTLASSIRADRERQAGGALVTSATADLALALRPIDSRWSLLERFQLRHESAGTGATSTNTLAVPTFAAGTEATFRAINNLAVNYRTGPEGNGHGLEASLYYGAKYVRGRYADETLDGFVDVAGVELRKDLGTHFDLGASAGAQHSWTSGTINWTLGASAGVSPAKNLWLVAGYNAMGYRDRDFADARWTRQGPFVTVRFKFDQTSLGDLVRPVLGRR